MTILKASSISKKFVMNKNELLVLNNINLSIDKGDFATIIGKSGAGKSTLLYVLSGLESTTTET